jgi:hypothetical protein
MRPPERFSGSEDYLHEAASRECGLTDFGAGDDYLPGLGVLLASMDADPRFTPEGRQLAFDAVVITLIARAYAEEGWKQHPQWRDAPIRNPIIIAGMSRTGTTALHKLMGADPQFQGLEHWLSQSPMPRPPRADWPANPAYRRAARWVDDMFAASPESQVAHNVVADEFEECLELQRQNFTCNRWACTWTAPSYDAWWQTQNERRTFARSADILRLIGCHDSRRWLLKNPSNIEFLDFVFEQFPDACIIQTHRDPLQFMPSICSLVHLLHIGFEGDGAAATRHLIGPRELEKWATIAERGMAQRKGREDRFIDIHHADFHADPMGTIQRIYDRFGLTMSEEAEQRIFARIEANPEGHGKHRYDMESFGLSQEAILERFAPYIERFGIGS